MVQHDGDDIAMIIMITIITAITDIVMAMTLVSNYYYYLHSCYCY